MITHQKQPNATTCVQTCLAMLLNEPVEKVIALAGDEGMSTLETYAFLERCGFTWNAMLLPSLIWDGIYIVTVPSLNLDARNHAILIETEKGMAKAYDPNNGKLGKQYYSFTVLEQHLHVLLHSCFSRGR